MTALALLMKDSTLALENKIECQAQLGIPTPTAADSPTCQCQVRVLQGTKTARQIIRLRLVVQKVVVGLPVTTAAENVRSWKHACVQNL